MDGLYCMALLNSVFIFFAGSDSKIFLPFAEWIKTKEVPFQSYISGNTSCTPQKSASVKSVGRFL